jgi:pyruvate-ferredoxin/flavodoxin oxidoreductase
LPGIRVTSTGIIFAPGLGVGNAGCHANLVFLFGQLLGKARRPQVFEQGLPGGRPHGSAAARGSNQGFQAADAKGKELQGLKFTLQVAPEDCTGCASCVFACPVTGKDAEGKKREGFKAINMRPQPPLRLQERENWDFFLRLPEFDRRKLKIGSLRQQQIMRPLFEFSGACAGCGETPYVKLLAQLFGDRALIGNATGCSSIYGGNLPTTPYAANKDGRGPTWSNSLFEDNAEFGLGMRLTLDKQSEYARELLPR